MSLSVHITALLHIYLSSFILHLNGLNLLIRMVWHGMVAARRWIG
jgi:hypothetical protein